ncbi:MAG: endolytic transglycosylase MltG [Calditrichia bacterium]
MKKIYQYIAQIAFGIFLVWRVLKYYGRRYLFFSIFFGFVVIGVSVWLLVFPPYHAPDLNGGNVKEVFIHKGSSFNEVADILADSGLVKQKGLFLFLGRLTGYENRMKAGLFEVPENMHPWQLLKYLSQPRFADIKVTFPEGVRLDQIAGILKQQLEIDSLRFMDLATDSGICQSLGVKANNLEGYLLPNTYFFTFGVNEEEVISILVRKTMAIFEPDSIRRQLEILNMTPHQILTLASIIEGEVQVDSERAVVSSVYHNRLDRGWPLQADPTIQYILPGRPRRLLLKDLEIDSPYNTYLHRGLPPGPINNPGKRSILAAIYPEKTNYMFFVATGDGGHHFSRTAAEHAQWKARFNRVRREVRRNHRH